MKKIISLLLLSFFSLAAKDIRVRSVDDFYAKLSAAPYSLAVFYDRDRDVMKDKSVARQVKDLEIGMRTLSKNPFYKGADLQFLRVDISRKDLDSLLSEYGIAVLPTYVAFIGRQQVGPQLGGFAYRTQIKNLIDQNLQSSIDTYMKQKQKQRVRELERAKIRAYNRAYTWGPYWYGGFAPYWAFGYRPYYRWCYW